MNAISLHPVKSKQWLISIITLVCFCQPLAAQDYQWAYTSGKPHRTKVVAYKRDHAGDLYLSTFTDSLSRPLYTTLEKKDVNQQLLWQKQVTGYAAIADMEINAANHAVVTGYFQGNISIDGFALTAPPTDNRGFIFETDEAGTMLWAHVLDPLNNLFTPVDLFIAANGSMYLASQVSGAGGLSAFHKLDGMGNIVKSEFTTSFDNRSFSHIISDSAGNVYVSGTCGNLASFDSIPANPNFSYQNVLLKYDSAFKAKWMIAKNYITFDNNNKLCTDGKNLYWVFDDFDAANHDTVKIIKVDYNAQVMSNVAAPVAISFLPLVDYSADHAGNSTLMIEAFTRMYIFRYDSSFNIVWQDTLLTQTSGSPLQTSLQCYDSCFYMASLYLSPSLAFNNITLMNPNAGMSYASDVFVCKWGMYNLMPLSYISLSARRNEDCVMLNWQTGDKTNSNLFTVEKSRDGISFIKIGSVKTASISANTYEFADHETSGTGALYYRLKQINKDGHYKYSNIAMIKQGLQLNAHIFPNPATDRITIKIESPPTVNIDISIYTLPGALVIKKRYRLMQGANFIAIPVNTLAAGNYVIALSGDEVAGRLDFTKR